MLRKKQRICPLATGARRYGCAVPPILLLAAVLAAEDVSFVLVGSAALYLLGRGRRDWDRLRDGARQVRVSDTGVMVASAATVTALRRSHKRTSWRAWTGCATRSAATAAASYGTADLVACRVPPPKFYAAGAVLTAC
jgi:hypothetical protein